MMNNQSQRDFYRDQRRAYRHQRRGYLGGISGVIWLLIILSIVTSHWFWAFFPLLFFSIPIFLFVVRPMLANNMAGPMQQQPYTQPGYQPPEQAEQPYVQQGYEQPTYQPYSQGYTVQPPVSRPHESYEEVSQPYQYEAEQQSSTQQYEEPLTMYPQE